MPDPPAPVITRFAPSPTGELHVGGARTALFAWAYARRHHGKFLLRFEDTDQKRSSKQAERNILGDLDWLGLKADNGDDIPRQSERLPLYDKAVEKLVSMGRAYEDDGAVRFRMDRNIAFEDATYGPIAVEAKDLEDFVIRKADGFPTFHLAVVVDDADMGVTHVIRGQEHLTNTTKHAALCDALGLPRPVWCHTPSIMNPDGSKMSKRDKAKAVIQRGMLLVKQGVAWAEVEGNQLSLKEIVDSEVSMEAILLSAAMQGDVDGAVKLSSAIGLHLPEIEVADFRRSGYTPATLLNYLALLGWNPGHDLERFDLDFLTTHFDLDRIGKSNSKFDRQKLAAFSQDDIARLPPEVWAQKLRAHFDANHPDFAAALGEHFDLFAGMYQERSKTLDDPATLGAFFVTPPTDYQPKAVKKNLTKNDGEGLKNLAHTRDALTGHDDWTADALHARLDALWQEFNLKNMGGVAQPLRVALTGAAVSPEIGPTLVLLGQTETIQRIEACLAQVQAA
ncbi:MAG: glutamate--tRNA ligase family protein [Planctomycetota bacterium]